MSTVAEIPKSHIQIIISVVYFGIFGVIATFAIYGLVVSQSIDLTTFLAIVGSFGALAGTIILWLFKTEASNTIINPLNEVREILKIMHTQTPEPIPTTQASIDAMVTKALKLKQLEALKEPEVKP